MRDFEKYLAGTLLKRECVCSVKKTSTSFEYHPIKAPYLGTEGANSLMEFVLYRDNRQILRSASGTPNIFICREEQEA